MFFRQRWRDSRLAYQPLPDKGANQRVILSPELSKYVWQPDVYFRNSKEARFHMVPTQNVLFGINPDGSIILSARWVHRIQQGMLHKATISTKLDLRTWNSPCPHSMLEFKVNSRYVLSAGTLYGGCGHIFEQLCQRLYVNAARWTSVWLF